MQHQHRQARSSRNGAHPALQGSGQRPLVYPMCAAGGTEAGDKAIASTRVGARAEPGACRSERGPSTPQVPSHRKASRMRSLLWWRGTHALARHPCTPGGTAPSTPPSAQGIRDDVLTRSNSYLLLWDVGLGTEVLPVLPTSHELREHSWQKHKNGNLPTPLKNRGENAQLWFPGIPNILLHNTRTG